MFIDAGRDFYHLVGPILEVGSILKRGNYGRILRAAGWQHNSSYREKLLENERLTVQANAPSRLDCIFCFLTVEHAREFQRLNWQGFGMHNLYRVHPLNIEHPAFICDYTHVNPLDPLRPDLWPENYWMRIGTETEQDFLHPEVLVFSDLVVDEIIE